MGPFGGAWPTYPIPPNAQDIKKNKNVSQSLWSNEPARRSPFDRETVRDPSVHVVSNQNRAESQGCIRTDTPANCACTAHSLRTCFAPTVTNWALLFPSLPAGRTSFPYASTHTNSRSLHNLHVTWQVQHRMTGRAHVSPGTQISSPQGTLTRLPQQDSLLAMRLKTSASLGGASKRSVRALGGVPGNALGGGWGGAQLCTPTSGTGCTRYVVWCVGPPAALTGTVECPRARSLRGR